MQKKHRTYFWIKVSVVAVLLIGIIAFCVIRTTTYNNAVNKFKDEVYEKYSVTLLEITSSEVSQYNKGRFIGPILAKEGSTDPRLYYVYLMKDEDNSMKLYIKNEKGCFIPITEMSVSYIQNH